MNDPRALIHALADGELEGEERAAAEALLAESPSWRREFDSARELRGALREKLAQPTTDDLWTMCLRRLDDIDATRRAESFVGRYAWAMCSFILFLILAAGLVQRTAIPEPSLRAREVAMLASGVIPDAVASFFDGNQFAQWYERHVGRARRQPERMQVIGGVAGQVNGHLVARVVLADRQGEVSFVVAQSPDASQPATEMSEHRYLCANTMRELNCVVWEESGFAMMVIGDRPASELREIATELR